MPPLNLSKTQKGYVPLEDRFKSFPKDSERVPKDDEDFYFMNNANYTLEHASLDLLYPTPEFLRKKLKGQRFPNIEGFYRKTTDGKIRVTDSTYRVGVVEV